LKVYSFHDEYGNHCFTCVNSFLTNISNFFLAKKGSKQFFAQKKQNRHIVFYSEDDFSYIHFTGLIKLLTTTYDKKISYLTSQIDDSVLEMTSDSFFPFYIGKGMVRSATFHSMDADLLIMTMPDLETFHLKRSKVCNVHYIYLFHALVSTHSNYRKGAFDHYDTVFLTSPYQAEEIRKTEEYYELPAKGLVNFGYPQLELLINEVKQWRSNNPDPALRERQARVIVAPSWSKQGILETLGEVLIGVLLKSGYLVTVRPHPRTTEQRPDILSNLSRQFSAFENFDLQTDINDKRSLYQADVMISDWSGVAMEFAFSCERPLIYIDVPKKCLNEDADKIDMVPIEVSIRGEIGIIVSPHELESLPTIINECFQNQDKYIEKAVKLRGEYVFNLGDADQYGVSCLNELSDEILSSDG
jgi:hypothetical protein